MNYFLSQIFILINYGISITTYQIKNRNLILILNFVATIATAMSYIFLSAYTGLAMTLVAAVRNIVFLIEQKTNSKTKKENIYILVFIYLITIILTILTYDGIFSLMSVCATAIYTFSVWQKNTTIYKLLGIPVGLVAIIYNIYIFSIVGIVFESLITISALTGFINEKRKKKSIENTLTLQLQN